MDSLVSGAAGASLEPVLGLGSVDGSVAYERYCGTIVLVKDGRRTAGVSREPIDLGKADMLRWSRQSEGWHLNRVR